MAFEQRVWNDRVSEYPNRRLLKDEDENETLVTFTRSEGQVSAEGDAWNAENMNDLESRIAAVLGTCEFYIGSDGKPYVMYIYNGEEVVKKLGSSEGTATTDQVLAGATFTSMYTPDEDDYSVGTMVNYSGVTQSAGGISNTSDETVLTIPEPGYYDKTSKIKANLSGVKKPISIQIKLHSDYQSGEKAAVFQGQLDLTIAGQHRYFATASSKDDSYLNTSWNITV